MKNSKIIFLALWTVLIAGLLLNGSTKSYATSATDYEALRAFYLSTNGDSWYTNTGWPDAATLTANPTMPAGTDLSTWYGVTVDGSGCVTELYIYFKNLSGNLPPELGNLSNLQVLSLSRNRLSGSIPPELGNLSNLQVLDLNQNQLSGSLPSDLGNLSNLQELSLYANDLNGSLPPDLGNLSNLEILGLYNNDLNGSIPSELGNLSNLQELILRNNELSSIPRN